MDYQRKAAAGLPDLAAPAGYQVTPADTTGADAMLDAINAGEISTVICDGPDGEIREYPVG
jgi:hypothetical protein